MIPVVRFETELEPTPVYPICSKIKMRIMKNIVNEVHE